MKFLLLAEKELAKQFTHGDDRIHVNEFGSFLVANSMMTTDINVDLEIVFRNFLADIMENQNYKVSHQFMSAQTHG